MENTDFEDCHYYCGICHPDKDILTVEKDTDDSPDLLGRRYPWSVFTCKDCFEYISIKSSDECYEPYDVISFEKQ
jgi:hypothetical protein